MYNYRVLSVVIQAGGQSRRMGQNKALMPFHGQPLVQRILKRLEPVADEIILTTHHPDDYAFLRIPMVSDVLPGKGALGGFLTAFQTAAEPFVAVVACDLPFVNPKLILYEKEIMLKNSRVDAVVPRSGGGLEPMQAVYRRVECWASVKDALMSGEMRVTSWLDGIRKHVLPEQDITRFDPHGVAFLNLNTPEEFLQAEELAKSLGLD
ncbi:MAG: molybdenum cofactor guanylyltransferase [Anaerolineae bacterium]|nr:molybdenum cofactor guanylyltransferase [Anaerolineae bacterium]